MTLATRMAAAQAAGILALRAVFESWCEELFTLPGAAKVSETELGGVHCDVVEMPGARPDRTILHFHGGGYVIGSPRAYRPLGAVLSRSCEAAVILPDYRLAPEHPSEAPVQDALAAYRALLANGTEPGGVVVSGDSAGGGLALALMIALRDSGEPLPACCVAMSPWTDGTLSGDSVQENADTDPIVIPDLIAAMVAMRFGEDGDRRDPLASPLFADWRGVPALLLFASRAETLRDDSIRVAEKARKAGVDVQLELYDDMVHVWPFFAGRLAEADRAVEQMAAFVNAQVSRR
jgi:acetyl esterase/lipase